MFAIIVIEVMGGIKMFSIFTKTNYTNNPQLALFLFKTLSVSTKTLSSKEEKIIKYGEDCHIWFSN